MWMCRASALGLPHAFLINKQKLRGWGMVQLSFIFAEPSHSCVADVRKWDRQLKSAALSHGRLNENMLINLYPDFKLFIYPLANKAQQLPLFMNVKK